MAWYRSGGGNSGGGGLEATEIEIHTATYDPETDVNPLPTT